MTNAGNNKEFAYYMTDLMQSVGPVAAKPMFGGYGIFLHGLMFGLIADGVLYLKADAQTQADFTDKGLTAFSYNKKGKLINMSYFQAPEEVLEDSEEMHNWASKAYATARRVAAKKSSD